MLTYEQKLTLAISAGAILGAIVFAAIASALMGWG